MRIKKSFFNIQSNLFIYIFRTIVGFILRTYFIKVLGTQILGLDGLFSNIIYILSVAELGVSSAISYSLYEPLSKKDYAKVSAYMSLYRKIYKLIGWAIFGIGLFVMIFLNKIVPNPPQNTNVYLIYFLFIFDTAISYFITYKDTLIFADQNNYKLIKFQFLGYLFMFVLQFISILYFKSYLLYIFSRVIAMILQRIVCNRYVTNEYKNVNFYTKEEITKTEKDKIKVNVKGMFLYKIGNNIINGTDNIIISMLLNLSLVGLYSNYLSLVLMVDTLLSSVYKGITSSFGNLIVEESTDTQENVFNKVNFLGHFLYGLFFVGYFILIDDFIVLWVGKKYVLPSLVVFFICFNFYINGIKNCTDSIKEASGLYDQDKYMSIIQAIINIVASIILVKIMGLVGVVIGTFVSYILVPCWNRPYILYKYLFKKNPLKYYIKYMLNVIFVLSTGFLIKYVVALIGIKNSITGFVLNVGLVTLMYMVTFVIVYCFTDDFRYYKNITKEAISKRRKINEN